MKIITFIAYVLATLFLLLLLKSLWIVLPHYWPAFGRFNSKLRQNYAKAGIWVYKLWGCKEFNFRKGSTQVMVMARTEKEAYRKLKKYTNANRKSNNV